MCSRSGGTDVRSSSTTPVLRKPLLVSPPAKIPLAKRVTSGGWTSMIRELANSVSGEASFPDLQMATFSVSSYGLSSVQDSLRGLTDGVFIFEAVSTEDSKTMQGYDAIVVEQWTVLDPVASPPPGAGVERPTGTVA
ncbi:hypothetical protein J1605_021233 [Eschrichtius robustus]|uniref:Uncharacterized protein n=1 Tax=Eschrichtius robustus TaxID=9764 RepID=A0AB34HIR9_ESCRO|nr:hypothetical protein J1605_021233 [Eschrichtius robustus]